MEEDLLPDVFLLEAEGDMAEGMYLDYLEANRYFLIILYYDFY